MRKRSTILNRLNELKYFRDNGLTKFKEIEEFSADKAKREQQHIKVSLFVYLCYLNVCLESIPISILSLNIHRLFRHQQPNVVSWQIRIQQRSHTTSTWTIAMGIRVVRVQRVTTLTAAWAATKTINVWILSVCARCPVIICCLRMKKKFVFWCRIFSFYWFFVFLKIFVNIKINYNFGKSRVSCCSDLVL